MVSGRFHPFNLLLDSPYKQNGHFCSFCYRQQYFVNDTIQNGCQRGDPGSVLGQALWDLLWKKWHWGRFDSEYFTFPQSATLKNQPARYSEMLLVYQITRRHVSDALYYSCITHCTECIKISHMNVEDGQSVVWKS